MSPKPRIGDRDDLETLHSFSHTVALIEWLLLVLVLYFFMIHQEYLTQNPGIILPLIVYTVLILSFHFFSVFKEKSLLMLNIEIWAMIIFISIMLGYSGNIELAIFNLYYLPIVSSAIISTRFMLLLQGIFILICYFFISYFTSHPEAELSFFIIEKLNASVEALFPLILVAYISSLLAKDIHRAKSKLIALSEMDQLTRLANMRVFNDVLEKEIERSARHGHSFCVLMIDIDNLKATNDKYGHEIGNKIICNIAICIQDIVRTSDIIARYGGDEFMALLVETDKKNGELAATRLHSRVSTSPISTKKDKIISTVSIGIACYPKDGETIQALISNADRAMYREKKHRKSIAKGKN